MPDVAAPVPSLWSKVKAAWSVGVKFASALISRTDEAVDLQLVAFCILFPFSVYWLQTRPTFSTGWCTCFTTLWGMVGLKDIIQRRPGGPQ
jgi:hypothetical protein